ncbi:MAG: CBS domain-containing protein, partial [Nocardioidaceae bacterium]
MSSTSHMTEALASKRGGRRRIGPSAVDSVPALRPSETVADARVLMAGSTFTYGGHVAVVDDGRFVGAVAADQILMADPTRGLADLADTGIPRATPVEYEESAAATAARYGHSLVAVVDLEDRFLGFVPPGRILQALADEHEEDVARFGGYLARSTQVRLALEERIAMRLWHRTPWLVLGLAGAMASAVLTASFEEEIARQV